MIALTDADKKPPPPPYISGKSFDIQSLTNVLAAVTIGIPVWNNKLNEGYVILTSNSNHIE